MQAFKFIFSRLISWLILMAVLTLLALSLQSSRQGSAALGLAGQRASTSEIAQLKKQLGEDVSFFSRFIDRYTHLAAFRYGRSVRGEDIMTLLLHAGRITLIISLLTAVFSLFYGFGFAMVASLFPKLEKILSKLHFSILSTPVFVLAIIGVWIFSLGLGLLPPGGSHASFWYLLPALTMVLKAGTRLALFIVEFLKREAAKQYALTAKAFGASRFKLYAVYLSKNIALPALSFWLVDFSSYIAGAVIVETVFSLPGLGSLILGALWQYDTNLLVAALVFSAFFVFLTGVAGEALQNYFNRFSGGEA